MILQSIISPKVLGDKWTQGSVLFARLKNHIAVFTKARKARTDMQSNAKYVVLKRDVNITKNVLRSVLQNMKDGLKEILKRFLRTKEHITTGIENGFSQKCERIREKINMPLLRNTGKETDKSLTVTTMWLWQSNLAILFAQTNAINVKLNANLMPITMIIQSLWKLLGSVVNVMEKSIEYLFQRERLNPMGAQAHVIVRPTQRKVLRLAEMTNPFSCKVTKSLRHTAGCNFYQGQCITNDLWMQNLRSTGI